MQGVFSIVRLLLDFHNHVTWDTITLVHHGLQSSQKVPEVQMTMLETW